MTALDHYHARMRRVLAHNDRYLDGDLDLKAVSSVAALSKFLFHPQFKAISVCPFTATNKDNPSARDPALINVATGKWTMLASNKGLNGIADMRGD